MLEIEREFWSQGVLRVAGVDEAGRGPLAGPVVAASVVFVREMVEREEQGLFRGLTDSKQLSPAAREFFFDILADSADVAIGVGVVESGDIDRTNILQATYVAMAAALGDLPFLPDRALVDGPRVMGLPCPATPVVGGDARSLSVAAASVVAKVFRDRRMRDLDEVYPEYGFAQHKGYGTARHVQALFEHGPCPVHRRSFGPVREAAAIHAGAAARAADRAR
ncbi:ribonuclease HII [Verrucomicrobiota bacterium]